MPWRIIKKNLYLESYPGKFLNSKDKNKSNKLLDIKKKEGKKKLEEKREIVTSLSLCNSQCFKAMEAILQSLCFKVKVRHLDM